MDLSQLRSCYEILELPFGATPEDVSKAYRQGAMVWHPDRFPSDPLLQQKATEKMREINRAYQEIQTHQGAVAKYITSQREEKARSTLERQAQAERDDQPRFLLVKQVSG